jgi:hypothetical protein
MPTNFTRRELAAGLLASAPLAAQNVPDDPRALLELGREELRLDVEAMKKIELDVNTQPAFVFRP